MSPSSLTGLIVYISLQGIPASTTANGKYTQQLNSLYVGRMSHDNGVWAGKIQPNEYMYVGLPDGSAVQHYQGAVQVNSLIVNYEPFLSIP